MNCVERAIRPAPSAPSMREIEMLFRPRATNEPARASDASSALEPNSRPGSEGAPTWPWARSSVGIGRRLAPHET